jgi:hypothetical protein
MTGKLKWLSIFNGENKSIKLEDQYYLTTIVPEININSRLEQERDYLNTRKNTITLKLGLKLLN